MAEITAAELKKLRAIESRIVTTTESLKAVRARRDEFRAEAVEARRQLRDRTRQSDKLEKQVTELVAENAALADELSGVRKDLETLSGEAASLKSENNDLSKALAKSQSDGSKAQKQLEAAKVKQARLEKQLANLSEKIEGKEPPELTPEHLSNLLGTFIAQVGSQTGLAVGASQLNLKVGFSGRGGGAFVIPTAGVDPDTLPELHELRVELSPGLGAVGEIVD